MSDKGNKIGNLGKGQTGESGLFCVFFILGVDRRIVSHIIPLIMKFKFILFLIPLVSSGLTLEQFIDVLEQVESNGNPSAIGDDGRAYGILQIHDIYVRDYNRITKSNLIHSDCFDREISREITKTILINYTKNLEVVNAKHLAFIHNAGGSGWRYVDDPNYGKPEVRKNLEIYFEKVLTELKKSD